MKDEIIKENNERLIILYNKYYKQLIKYANKFTKDEMLSEDLISNMFINLIEKPNNKLWNKKTFNLNYLYKIIYTRWINDYNFKNKYPNYEYNDNYDILDDEYNYEYDIFLDETMQTLFDNLKNIKQYNLKKYAKAYTQVKLYNMSIKNIAQKMNKSTNTLYYNFNLIDIYLSENINYLSEKNKINC